nr:hypothetical protein [Actinoplanes derwentensis]GID83301.1 hypothetical protein Ade03nite_22250 [Actinoplanes derwentensis]
MAVPALSAVPALAGPGFTRPGLPGADADRYAVAAIRLWLLVPLAPMAECAPEARAGHVTYAARRFGLPAAERLSTELSLPEARTATIKPGDLVRAILASATPDRDDRLFPGDPEQFTDDGAGLGYGAAGVLYALAEAGAVPDSEHVDWLRRHATTTRPGLWSGADDAEKPASVLESALPPVTAVWPSARTRRPKQRSARSPAPGPTDSRDAASGSTRSHRPDRHLPHHRTGR